MTDDPFDALPWAIPIGDAPPPPALTREEPSAEDAGPLPFAPPVRRPAADDGFLLYGFDAPGEEFHPRLRRLGGAV